MNPTTGTAVQDDAALHRRWTLIEAKLQMAKPHLVMAGSVNRRRLSDSRSVWVCRFREIVGERKVNRSIYLGPAPLAEMTRALIGRWRQEAISPQERRKKTLLHACGLIGSSRGYSRRARRRLRGAAVHSARDPIEALTFAVGLKYDDPLIRYGKPPGRHAKSGLW